MMIRHSLRDKKSILGRTEAVVTTHNDFAESADPARRLNCHPLAHAQ